MPQIRAVCPRWAIAGSSGRAPCSSRTVSDIRCADRMPGELRDAVGDEVRHHTAPGSAFQAGRPAYPVHSSTTVRSTNSGGPASMSAIIALAGCSLSSRRGSCSRSRACSSLSNTTNP